MYPPKILRSISHIFKKSCEFGDCDFIFKYLHKIRNLPLTLSDIIRPIPQKPYVTYQSQFPNCF